MKSPRPAGGFGKLGILRRGSPAGSTAQLPGCFPAYPQRLSLCHPGLTARGPSTALHRASISHGSQTPTGQSASVAEQPGLKEEEVSELGVQPPLSSALQNQSGLVRDAQARPNGDALSCQENIYVFPMPVWTVWCGCLTTDLP